MTPLARRQLVWLALLATLVAGVASARMSSAALTPATSAWAYGEAVLSGEPVSAGLFDVDGMLPGQTEVRCQLVRYEGAREHAGVRLYATAVGGGLAPFLEVLVETGARCDHFAPRAVAFAGTLDELPASWHEAASTWQARRGQRRAYRFSVTLRPDPRAEGLDASAGFVWEAGASAAAGPLPARSGRATDGAASAGHR